MMLLCVHSTPATPWSRLFAQTGYCLVGLWIGSFAILGSLGCKSHSKLPALPGVPDDLDAVVSNAIAAVHPAAPGNPPRPAINEDLAVSEIAKVLQGSADWLAWPVTVDCSARISGGKVLLETEATAIWPEVEEVSGSCWLIVRRDGRWIAACFDYIRAGQTFRKLPWAPGPDEDPVDWIILELEEEAYFLLTGLCRDKRRNIPARGPIRRIQ